MSHYPLTSYTSHSQTCSLVPNQISESQAEFLGIPKDVFERIVHLASRWTSDDLKDISSFYPSMVLNPSNEDGWRLIETAPTDDQLFLVGGWVGETIWDETNERHVFIKEPRWVQAISHHENPEGPHVTRGWNHRNGPLSPHRITHWSPLKDPPKFRGFVIQEIT